jgi:hypothetical protein
VDLDSVSAIADQGAAKWPNQSVHRSRDPVLGNGRRHRRGPVTLVVLAVESMP